MTLGIGILKAGAFRACFQRLRHQVTGTKSLEEDGFCWKWACLKKCWQKLWISRLWSVSSWEILLFETCLLTLQCWMVKIGAGIRGILQFERAYLRSKSLTQHRNLQDQIQTKYNINLISILILYFVCIYVGGGRPVGTIQIYQSCQEDGDDRVPGWYHTGFGRITSQVRRNSI